MKPFPLLAGAAGMVFVGGSVAVSGVLAGAPLLTVQCLRYAVACLLLGMFARVTGSRVIRPRRTEWLWIGGVVVIGMFVFNLALVLSALAEAADRAGNDCWCSDPLSVARENRRGQRGLGHIHAATDHFPAERESASREPGHNGNEEF